MAQLTRSMTASVIKHADLCKLSRIFNQGGLWNEQDRRINEWLKSQIMAASVSDEHSQSEDPKELSAQHASAVCAAETPDQSPVQKEGMVEDVARVFWQGYYQRMGGLFEEADDTTLAKTHCRAVATEAVRVLETTLLTALTETKKERDEANRVLGLAVEQAARSAERTMEAIARSEALQAENEALKVERDEASRIIAAQLEAINNYRDNLFALQAELATLTKRIEEYERGLEPFAKAAKTYDDENCLMGKWTDDNRLIAGTTVGDFRRARSLLNTKGESDV